ncbi:vomeromodulin-like [Echinops telfairi]|uniref:Vomeromodulin-like n=1 Tax=Echinops telfairi TaxID=9371 RepID=A0AC55DH42_ECHTE|nr:vomeromodulin-like [Echinops telfairi]
MPVQGSWLPPHPKNANMTITLSHNMIKMVVALTAKKSSISINGMDARILRVSYSYQKDNKVNANVVIEVLKDGRPLAIVTTVSTFFCKSTVSKDKMTSEIKLLRHEDSAEPPEAMDEAKEAVDKAMGKFTKGLQVTFKEVPVPQGPFPSQMSDIPVSYVKLNILASN